MEQGLGCWCPRNRITDSSWCKHLLPSPDKKFLSVFIRYPIRQLLDTHANPKMVFQMGHQLGRAGDSEHISLHSTIGWTPVPNNYSKFRVILILSTLKRGSCKMLMILVLSRYPTASLCFSSAGSRRKRIGLCVHQGTLATFTYRCWLGRISKAVLQDDTRAACRYCSPTYRDYHYAGSFHFKIFSFTICVFAKINRG